MNPIPTAGVNDFSLFQPLEKASCEQKVSTPNDSSIVIWGTVFIKLAPKRVVSRQAGHLGFVG